VAQSVGCDLGQQSVANSFRTQLNEIDVKHVGGKSQEEQEN